MTRLEQILSMIDDGSKVLNQFLQRAFLAKQELLLLKNSGVMFFIESLETEYMNDNTPVVTIDDILKDHMFNSVDGFMDQVERGLYDQSNGKHKGAFLIFVWTVINKKVILSNLTIQVK